MSEPFAVPCGPFRATQQLRSFRGDVRLFGPDQILLLNDLWQAGGVRETLEATVDPLAQPQSPGIMLRPRAGLCHRSRPVTGPDHQFIMEPQLQRMEGVSGMVLLMLLSKRLGYWVKPVLIRCLWCSLGRPLGACGAGRVALPEPLPSCLGMGLYMGLWAGFDPHAHWQKALLWV
jgi:hypothetical protein